MFVIDKKIIGMRFSKQFNIKKIGDDAIQKNLNKNLIYF